MEKVFKYNKWHVCLNPNNMEYRVNQHYYCVISTARYKGKWYYAINVSANGSGHGYGVTHQAPWVKSYGTERQAKVAALYEARKWLLKEKARYIKSPESPDEYVESGEKPSGDILAKYNRLINNINSDIAKLKEPTLFDNF